MYHSQSLFLFFPLYIFDLTENVMYCLMKRLILLNMLFFNHLTVTIDIICEISLFVIYSQGPSVKNIKCWKKKSLL